jgi:hypothetical protein
VIRTVRTASRRPGPESPRPGGPSREESFQVAENECGPDHYQVRRYDAWYRHIDSVCGAVAAPADGSAACAATHPLILALPFTVGTGPWVPVDVLVGLVLRVVRRGGAARNRVGLRPRSAPRL